MARQSKKQYRYLFGPVPSRRLGLSLGVDLVLPKTCSLDCVYCESGRTTRLTTERSMDVPPSAVIAELSDYLSSSPELDHVTFSGCGEPLLNTGIEEIAGFMKRKHPEYRLALLTNSTLFHRADVRREVREMDVIVASLDAVSPKVFQKINRPAEGIDPETMIRGLTDLRMEYKGQLWIEIFIVPGLNDTDDELEKLACAARVIGADRIQLNSLDRPGSESWVQGLNPPERDRIAGFFSGIEIIGHQTSQKQGDALNDSGDLQSLILDLIKRRPSTAADIHKSSGADETRVKACLDRLEDLGKVKSESLERGKFYRIT